MNPYSGQVVQNIDEVDELQRAKFRALEDENARMAREFLDGAKSRILDLSKKENPLVKLAAKYRAQDKKAANRKKNKIARKARKLRA